MFLGFSVEYENTLRGNSISCRLIGSDVLETTLNDYCNGASKEYPIAVIDAIPIISNKQEQNGNISNNKLEIYTDTKNCKVKFLNIKYIKYPNIVRFDKDLSKCVNCDFPDYIHFEIVERAAMKFIASISSNPVNFNQPKQ